MTNKDNNQKENKSTLSEKTNNKKTKLEEYSKKNKTSKSKKSLNSKKISSQKNIKKEIRTKKQTKNTSPNLKDTKEKNKSAISRKEKVYKEIYPCKKKFRLKKEIKLILLVLPFLVIISFIYLGTKIFKEEPAKPKEEEIVVSYRDYYHEQVKLLKDKNIFQLIDGEFKSVGIIYKDLVIELLEDEYLEDGYFKVRDSDFYIDYKDIVLDDSILKESKKTYLNYIPYNESIKTLDKTNFYFDDKLLFTISNSMTFPILIKEDNYYGIIYQDKLYYIKKDEVTLFESENTILKHTNAIATLVYHFTYDSNSEEEKRNCKNSNVTICLSDTLFKEHLTYMKDNGFYTATMNDLSLFIDGKAQLPEKTVVITIDDGYFVSAAIKVLEEMEMHATLFLIGTAGKPEDYKSDSLEIHSHTYALHYPGACSGGQGSPLKCLSRDVLLNDLKKSREQLNGSTVFCYPFFEYNDYAISILKEAGFEMAFIGGRYKIKVGSNKYKLPRYGIINTTYVDDIKKIIN